MDVAEIVKGTKPTEVTVLGRTHAVANWVDVLGVVLGVVVELGEDVFDEISADYPRYLGRSYARMRRARRLSNGGYFECNLSAESIRQLISQIAEKAEIEVQIKKVPGERH